MKMNAYQYERFIKLRRKQKHEKQQQLLKAKQERKRFKQKRSRVKKRSKFDLLQIKVKGLDYNSFLKSEYWIEIRKVVFARDKFMCTVCGNKSNLQVHHTTYKHHKNEHNPLGRLANCM